MLSTFKRDVASRTLTIESGKLAQQANASLTVRYGDSVVLVTAGMDKPRENVDFFPLTVDFEERLYARGKIPGSFHRREGRPSTQATLVARLTDRPIRPLFPKGFRNEVQVIVTALSSDQENPLDILAVIGASAALSISDIPFEGPIGVTRVAYLNGQYIANPTYAQLDKSELDLVVAGSRDGVIMMEAGAQQVSEDVVLEAIRIAQGVNLEVIALQEEMVRAIGKPKAIFQPETFPPELKQRVSSILDGRLSSVFGSPGKAQQGSQLDTLKAEVVGRLGEEYESGHISSAFDELVEEELRHQVLDLSKRPDGRGIKEIRPISCEVSVLPRTHGSGLFTRGETQVLGVTTLGSVADAQKIDTLSPEESKRFLLHYNFPPYSTGEVKRVSSPGRREIGHGALAERALEYVIPDEEEFPYTIRVVAEVLSSNGSTSMGSVCAGTLSLLDAGVPIKSPVAGISIGLITGENGRYATLTDIQGLEDHMGDMDFKVAGSQKGITAIQLDIKLKSISMDVIRDALTQAREARLFILERIRETIGQARPELSRYAPRMLRIRIPVEKIGAVIGPSGKTIRGIIEQTKATVDIQDDGTVIIGSTDEAAANKAVEIIERMTREIKVGDIFTGKVVRITNFGAFVELMPGKDGLVHISELADYRVGRVEDEVQLGEEITVVVIQIDQQGRINLSRRALLEETPPTGEDGVGRAEQPERPERFERTEPGGGRPPYGGRPRPGGDGGGYRPQGARPGGPSRPGGPYRPGGPSRSGPGGPRPPYRSRPYR
jgi:polyribonucleotide nucleotidyltransferase